MKTPRIYGEACDASAAVQLGDDRHFVAATDDDNVLRVYDSHAPGLPVARLDVTSFLDPDDLEHTEGDIEGAARIGDRIYWIGSHGRSSSGKPRKIRRRLFATRLLTDAGGVGLETVGVPYRALLRDLHASAVFAPFGLDEASERAPEEPGGLNIEGLAPTAEDDLLVGFRNPVPEGRALLVRVHAPHTLVDEAESSARLSVGGWLDLGGRGIRAIERVSSQRGYVIVAGAHDDTKDFALYLWSGHPDDQPRNVPADLSDLNPEEVIVRAVDAQTVTLTLFSDDGTRPCKLAPASERRFRAVDVRVRL